MIGKNTYGNDREVKVKTTLNADGMELKEIDANNPDEKVKTTNYGIGKANFKYAKKDNLEKLETKINHEGTLVRGNKKQSTYYVDGTTINELDDEDETKSRWKISRI